MNIDLLTIWVVHGCTTDLNAIITPAYERRFVLNILCREMLNVITYT